MAKCDFTINILDISCNNDKIEKKIHLLFQKSFELITRMQKVLNLASGPGTVCFFLDLECN